MKAHRGTIIAGVFLSITVFANSPRDGFAPMDESLPAGVRKQVAAFGASLNQVDPRVAAARAQRRAALRARDEHVRLGDAATAMTLAAPTVTDRVLVVLVEFAGTNMLTWTPSVSMWDPFGQCNPAEFNGSDVGNAAASIRMATNHFVTGPTNFTYVGPLHNEIQRPLSAEDASGRMIWTPDFSPAYYSNIIAGGGVAFSYTRANGSAVYADYTGLTLKDYFLDMSGGRHLVLGDVVGWVQVTNSIWWYGADACPGGRSGTSAGIDPGSFGMGSLQTLVLDSLQAVKTNYPSFPWATYDVNGDGLIDHLWIVHAGLGEEDNTNLLNRTTYGEASVWSRAGYIASTNLIVPGVRVGSYTLVPENCGISALARQYAVTLGAGDLLAYQGGVVSPGFWSLMADHWSGFPTGYLPPSLDPKNLDEQGWLNPQVLSLPTITTVVVGQTSAFPGGAGVQRGVRLLLPDQAIPRAVQPFGAHEWWGGAQHIANGMMTLIAPVAIPTNAPALTFDTAYGIETEWDFMWVQVSPNGGATWTFLTNAHTTSSHVSGWIGDLYGLTGDLAAAGIGGFTDYNSAFPSMTSERFSLARFAGSNLLVRFWYMTDWGTVFEGPFVDNIAIVSSTGTNFFDGGEGVFDNWTYVAPWELVGATNFVPHAYYLQWRNVHANGGYDRGLGDARGEFGPANGGLLVWYENERYEDNEIFTHLTDAPGYGPKGKLLLVDAHPYPYRDPYWVTYGYTNEGGNVTSRSQMRDAAFSRQACVPFFMTPDAVYTNTVFAGRPAVDTFSDALGYYPGSEFVSRGPGYVPASYKWVTPQFDASVVIPAKVFYGVNAPGYTRNEEFRYNAVRFTGGRLSAYWYGTGVGLGYAGGSGNPADVGGQYGWNVRILSQSDTMATLQISATTVAQPVNIAPVDGATGVPLCATLVATNFIDSSPSASHAASHWQISTTATFGSIVWDSGETTQALTSLSVPAGVLGARCEYFWRVRYIDSFAARSMFSTPTRFVSADAPRYVSTNGAALWPYDTWRGAASNIQDALDAAPLGASVHVSNGVYRLAAQVMVTNGNAVRSVGGAGVTLLLCSGAGNRGAYVAHARAVFDGFTISNGNVNGAGGGVYLGAGIVRNCVLAGNKATGNAGGGVYAQNGRVENCTFSGNAAGTLGGGIYALRAVVDGCVINGNNAGDAGGGMHAATSVVNRCIIRDNLCMNRGGGIYATATVLRSSLVTANLAGQDAGGACLAGDCTVDGCTLVGNQAATGVLGGLGTEPNTRLNLILNTIIRLNQPLNADARASAAYAFSCITPEVTGTAMITNDPLFIAAGMGDYHLQPVSPCVNTGTNLPWMATATDLDGNPRIYEERVDMGCYEVVPEPLSAGVGALLGMLLAGMLRRRRTHG